MSTSAIESQHARAQNIHVSDEELVVELEDGRVLSVPLAWYPRLFHSTPEEQQKLRIIGQGEGIHWPDLDEDISVAQLLRGIPSGESQSSLQRWLKQRGKKPR